MHPVPEKSDILNVAIVVGNEVLCWGIEAMLRSLSTVGVVHRCTSADQVPSLIESRDIGFLIGSGLDMEWLEKAHPQCATAGTRILLLVDESSADDIAAYGSMPVDGFLSQQQLSADVLYDAFRRCRMGEMPMPAGLTRALLAHANAPGPRRPVGNLTSREIEALTLLVKGLSNKQIARRLMISTHGAKRLVASVMLKLDAPNRTSAAVHAVRAGIVGDEQ